jgi:hypothetical protein
VPLHRRPGSRRTIRGIGAALVFLWTAACQLFVTLEASEVTPLDAGAERVEPAALDAGPDASPLACGHRPPSRAAFDAGTREPERAYYFVLGTNFNEPEAGTGFDLDCVDTKCDGPDAGALRCLAAPKARVCDQQNGVDDHLHLAAKNHSYNLVTTTYDSRVKNGIAGIVFGILGYNGMEDDPEVGFTIFPSGGIRATDGCAPGAAKQPVEDAYFPPSFDGCDLYFGDPDFVGGGNATPIQTVHAYVTGGQLVADEPLRLTLPYVGFYAEATALFVQARLSRRADGPFELTEGIVGGRLGVSTLLRMVGEQPLGGGLVCHDALFWAGARQQICAELDMPAASDADPSSPCGAISFAVSFSASPIQLSDRTAPRVESPPACNDVDAQDFNCP